MSCANFAGYISGIKFSLPKDMFNIPNPLYGIVKYDPETGEKVEKHKKDTKTHHEFVSFIDTNDRNVFRMYGRNDETTYFFGIVYSAHYDECITIPVALPSKPESYLKLINMLKQHNISYEEGNFLVSHMSC